MANLATVRGVLSYVAAAVSTWLACMFVMGLVAWADMPLAASLSPRVAGLAGCSVLMISAILGGAAGGALVALLWARRRLIIVPALLALALSWADLARSLWTYNGTYYQHPMAGSPLFWVSATLCLSGFLLAYRVLLPR